MQGRDRDVMASIQNREPHRIETGDLPERHHGAVRRGVHSFRLRLPAR